MKITSLGIAMGVPFFGAHDEDEEERNPYDGGSHIPYNSRLPDECLNKSIIPELTVAQKIEAQEKYNKQFAEKVKKCLAQSTLPPE